MGAGKNREKLCIMSNILSGKPGRMAEIAILTIV
jgi:hypothetical protein